MKTTSEQRAELRKEALTYDQVPCVHGDTLIALLADAERAEVLERVLRDVLSASGIIAMSDAITKAKAALGETT